MLRSFIVSSILVSAISPAAAQKAREHLPAINGVEFGSTFVAAREKLGSDFEADSVPGDDKVKTLLGGPVPFNGASYMLNYTFGGAGERLTTVYAQDIDSQDFSVCRANWSTAMTGLTAQFGKPETMSEDFGTQTQFGRATFKFDDGSAITGLLLGCILQITYERTPSKK